MAKIRVAVLSSCAFSSGLLFALAAAAVAPDNLAPNPGFEDADTDQPAFWSRRTPDDPDRTLEWDAAVAHSGARSLSIRNHGDVRSRWRTGHLGGLVLEPATDALLSAWIRTCDVTGGAHLRLYCISADRRIVAQPDSKAVSGAADWTQVRLSYTVPEDTAYVMIYLELTGTGAAWYDDVVLEGTPGAAAASIEHESFDYRALDFARLEGYVPGRRGKHDVIELPPGLPRGRAETAFWGDSGRYDVAVTYLDESDGAAALRMLVNGREVAQWTFDQTPASSKAQEVVREKRIPGVDLQRRSRITLEGTANLGEYGRVHKVTFTPAGRFQGTLLDATQLEPVASLRVYEDPREWRDARTMVARYIQEGAKRLDEVRDQELAALSTPAEWRERQQRTRTRLPEFFGDFAPKCPLQPRSTGTLDRDDYAIDKVVFESQRGFYCTANVYVPKRRAFPLPGVLFTCGHAGEGKAYHLYHEACLGLALKGYVVLALDPIGQGERLEYVDPNTGENVVGPCVAQHHYLGRPAWLVGRSLAGYRTWDCIRALDYLAGRPEVDPARLAAVGNSGGGQMALLITAVDERIRVCAAAHPGGSMENTYLLGQGIIDRQVLSLIPPRPCAFIVGEDSGEVDGHTRRLEDMRRFYRGLGVDHERGRMVLVHGVHNMEQPKREAAYAWLNQWFDKEAEGPEEPPLEPETVADLNCTPTGCVHRDLGSETGQTLNAKRAETLCPERDVPQDQPALRRLLDERRAVIAERLGMRIPGPRDPPPCAARGAFQAEGFEAEKLVIETEPGIHVPALFLTPETPTSDVRVVHAAHLGKPTQPNQAALALGLVRKGYAVLSIDVRGAGETDPRVHAALLPLARYDPQQWRVDSNAINAAYRNTTMAAMRAFDVIRAVDYLAAREEGLARPVVLVGEGLGGVWALIAAAFDLRPAAVVCAGTIPSYKLIVQAQYYASRDYFWVRGALEDFDLPDLIGLVAPRPAWLIHPRDARLEPLGSEPCESLCRWPQAVYDALDAPHRLRIVSAAGPCDLAGDVAAALAEHPAAPGRP